MSETHKVEALRQSDVEAYPDRIFLISQADAPQEIRHALLDSAVSDGWIGMLVNINAAMFAGLILLTAEFGAIESLYFLLMQVSTTIIGTLVILVLQLRRQNENPIRPRLAGQLLLTVDLLVMGGWAFGTLLFVSPESYERSLLIIVLLTAAGIGAATLNARILQSLIFGRIFLFLPAIVYFLYEQPPFWSLLICTLVFSTGVSIGIGYAVHVQHLNGANLGHKLRESGARLKQAMLVENEVQKKLLDETKLRERFLHSISHDLNQPLSAVGLYLHSLGKTKLPKPVAETVDAAQQSLGSAKSLIKSVSQLAWLKDRLPAANIKCLPLAPLLNRIAEDSRALAIEKNVRFVFVDTSVWVMADEEFLERVLRNLVQNAIQYSDEGKILFGVRRRPGDLIDIVVADDGLGISRQHQAHIFEAFYQIETHTSRRSGNIGLGLSIVKDLVMAMGGEISLKSQIDKGSAFSVRMPRHRPQVDQKAVHPKIDCPSDKSARTDSAAQKTALLLEDNQGFLDDIKSMLLKLGYRVDTAKTPSQISQVTGAVMRDYEFVILDYDLGNDVTAIDVLKRNDRANAPSTLIISQFDNADMRVLLEKMGLPFLKKPFSREQLGSALSDMSAARRAVTNPDKIT